ncbi:CD82 antigen-like isoform X2 [Saccostrea cucullata]|uniref:CD82 antigen-like isoform X2 n=1 Tax=Saccostrea cuccullata TaxID=36930 RepID=UPI002ED6B7E0
MPGTCCKQFGKWFLIVLNIIFFLLGIGLLVAGIIFKINAVFVEVLPTLNKVQVVGNNLGDLLNSVSILVIIIGIFVALVAGFGLFGVYCKKKTLLIVFNERIKNAMLGMLQKNFIDDSFNTTNALSNGWNYIFLRYDCCAVNPVNGPNNDFDETPWCKEKGECFLNNAQIPKTCCDGVDESDFETKAPADCFSFATDDYKTKGCFDRLQEFIQKYSTPAIGVSVVGITLEILAFVFAIVLCRQIGQESSKIV